MGLDLKDLKLEFRDYLIDCGIIKEDPDDSDKVQSESIFAHKEEFKDFVEEKYGIDLDTPSSSIFELSELEINDGQVALLDENSNMNGGGNKDANFMISFLNSLLQENDFVEKLSSGEDTSLNDDEILKFLVYASSQDDVDEKLTFDDILLGYENAQRGNYNSDQISLDIFKDADETSEMQDSDEVDEIDDTPSISPGGRNGAYTGGTVTTPPKEEDKKILSEMPLSELQVEKTETIKVLETEKANLETAVTQAKDTAIEQKTALQELFDKQANINQESKQALLDYFTKAGDKKLEIAEKKTEIANYETSLSASNSNLQVANAQLSSYKNALKLISPDDEEASSKKGQIQGLIEQQEKTIDDLEKKVSDITKNKEQAQLELTELEVQLAEIENLDKEQQIQFNEVLSQLDADTSACLSSYIENIDGLDTISSQFETTFKSTQEYLDQIDSEIIKKNDKSAKNMASMSGNIFSNDSGNYEWTDYTGHTTMPYGILAPEHLDDTNKVPVMVFLHALISDKAGHNETRAAEASIKANFENYNLEKFNGLIVCPQSPDYWNNQAANIDEILNDVASKYNIDPDNIVIAGHSRGGTGVIETLDSDVFKDGVGFEFKSGVCFAGYPRWADDQNPSDEEEKIFDLAAPIYVYADDATNKSEFDEKVTNVAEWIDRTGAQHGYLAYNGFRDDEDGDGRSDIIEKLFGVQEPE